MSLRSEHEALKDLLPEAALGTLDTEEQHAVDAHIASCPACRRTLQGFVDTVAAMTGEAPAVKMEGDRKEAVRARVLGRAAAQRPLRGVSGPQIRPLHWTRMASLARWGGWAAAAGLAGVLLMHHGIHAPLGPGWIVAGALVLVAGTVVAYALRQRRTAAWMRARLDEYETSSSERRGEMNGA